MNRSECRLFPNLFRYEGVFAYPVYKIQAASHWKWSCSFHSWTGCAGLHHHLPPTLSTTLSGLWPGDRYLIAPHSCTHPGCPLPVLLPGRQRRIGETQGLKGWFLSSQSQMMGRKLQSLHPWLKQLPKSEWHRVASSSHALWVLQGVSSSCATEQPGTGMGSSWLSLPCSCALGPAGPPAARECGTQQQGASSRAVKVQSWELELWMRNEKVGYKCIYLVSWFNFYSAA